ncbi:carbohydrate ABC transporter substrate-binding protein [Parasedimentitalea marina]|uniref:Probable sugar-binding periplasmic protein n=1 Tax=Parasedimentitalea marina TaxID=2483033 RepID=A0A3T0N214_9RHOB|nr:ABC transporter substrate-binding protein [Parasedimentitalea marina]AZV78063.1 carbohydrate ABC transporter substrate-binding protein [Parasedimentitalea marina]
MKCKTKLLSAAAIICASSAGAADLEVTHWWTSGGEAAAVSEFAKAFTEKTDHNWVDGAIAGSGGTARPIIISRIIGGDPMAATQLNHGRQSEELIEAGLMTDLTEIAEAGGWKDLVNPSALLDACTFEGRIYCVPVNIHSAQWLWLSHDAFAKAGVAVPQDWHEFVAAAPALEKAGLVPLAMGQQGWQQNIAFGTLTIAIAGIDDWREVSVNKNADVAAGGSYTAVFEAAASARELARDSNVQDWNLATNMVISGKAGGQIMGDWAQGEFQVAGQVAGDDYTCLPGLGINQILDTGGDAFYFPKVDDPAVQAAQLELATLLISPEVQVAFNLAKGSLPVRGDIDMSSANSCMQKGLQILADGGVLPSNDMNLSADTTTQVEDLMAEFWASDLSAADAQARYVDIIARAD